MTPPRFGVVIDAAYLEPEARKWFGGDHAVCVVAGAPLTGHRFARVVMLWTPETVEDLEWYHQLRSKVLPGDWRITFLVSPRTRT